MNTEKIIWASVIFLIGFLSANLLSLYFVSGFETPFSFDYLGFSSKETPFDFIKENQIEVYPNKIVIYIDDATIGRYAPTGSMKPLLDEGSNGIRVVPKSTDDIHIGDIISFEHQNYLIIHRVIDKGVDSEGVYFITKGDNNDMSDGKVRFEDVKYKTIGILW